MSTTLSKHETSVVRIWGQYGRASSCNGTLDCIYITCGTDADFDRILHCNDNEGVSNQEVSLERVRLTGHHGIYTEEELFELQPELWESLFASDEYWAAYLADAHVYKGKA